MTGQGQVSPGSSPLTRGKRGEAGRDDPRAGLIPAHAGKTETAPLRAIRCTAHPRSRGENLRRARACSSTAGSSPLTRGKPVHLLFTDGCERLIPAHAGKTRRARGPRNGTAAHPRSRGENIWGSPTAGTYKGSSPLTRGKPLLWSRAYPGARLIPAHAGKTWSRPAPTTVIWAHPRSRGENPATPGSSLGSRGSSPLTRGKRCGRPFRTGAAGLIPAHAGKTRA